MKMEQKGIIEGALGRIFTAAGASTGVVVADHASIAQGALVALAGVAIDLAIRWLRAHFKGN